MASPRYLQARRTIRALEHRLRWLPPTLARVTLGWIFVQSGWGKLHHLDQVVKFFTDLGIPAPQIQAPFAAGTELVCGALAGAGADKERVKGGGVICRKAHGSCKSAKNDGSGKNGGKGQSFSILTPDDCPAAKGKLGEKKSGGARPSGGGRPFARPRAPLRD